ncbi:MAG TPA: phosphomannomutase/phosphoglucomutase [Gammaproteobacteria bacterium]|jgi:phosphomannomutase/phosphoglucomutase|nr:phosphomannomutase/phosphoglucomutase [Gammaproteobacteria bacterium]
MTKLPQEIFKAYDIRGIVDKSLTETVTEQIGQAIGTEATLAGDRSVVIGRDGRLSGPSLATALSEGIRSTGCDVVDIGMVPTPVTYFATHHLETGSAVSITGSHNPPEYNGLKVMIAGETLAGDRIQMLRKRIEEQDLLSGNGSHHQESVTEAYVARITGDITLQRPLKVVLDCGNGVGGSIAPRVLKEIGCDVTELFSDVDGTFPNHHPDPSQPENLNDLIEMVITTKADFGMALDGDGDRLGVVSATGDIIFADRQLLLFARDVLSRHPGAEIIYDVKCSKVLPDAIRESGGLPTMWKTGHSFIKAKLKESGAILAGEMSGHIFFKERWYGFDDGIYAAARLCELLSAQDDPPTAVFKSIPELVSTPELRLEMEEGEHHALVEQFVRNARFPTGEICTIDGIRVDFKTGFGLARASNTTSTVILRFEADRQQQLTEIQEQFRTQLLALRPELNLPF